MPTWTTPPTFVAGRVISPADIATYFFGNDSYLLNRPVTARIRNNAGAYSTSSTTFVDIDATNLSITLAMSGSAVLLTFSANTRLSGTDVAPMFDFVIDGVRYATGFTQGMGQMTAISNTKPGPINVWALVTGLSAASHTFKPQWAVPSAGTSGIESDLTTSPIVFGAVEIG